MLRYYLNRPNTGLFCVLSRFLSEQSGNVEHPSVWIIFLVN